MQIQATPRNARPCRIVLSKHFAQAKNRDRKISLEQRRTMSQNAVEDGSFGFACGETVTRSREADKVRRPVSAR